MSGAAANRFLAKTEGCSADGQVWVRPHASAHGLQFSLADAVFELEPFDLGSRPAASP
jgi:hypothetical protein